VYCGPKNAVPKFASGSTPELDDGASTIHSAEDLAGVYLRLATVSVIEKDFPVVVSNILSVNSLLGVVLYVTLAEILSFGLTGTVFICTIDS